MGIDTAAERALAFDTGDMGVDASYTPVSGGSASAVVVIFDQPLGPAALGRLGAQQSNHKLQVLVSAVASPREGDTFVIGSETFKAGPRELNPDGTIWTIFLNKQ